MPAAPSCCVSVDMDGVRRYAAIHGAPDPGAGAWDPVWSVALGRFLELFDAAGVRATFFCVGEDLEQEEHAALALRVVEAGHEIASHSHEHRYDLRARGLAAIRADLEAAERAIEAATGRRPRGFRAPGYNLDPGIAGVLAERGYDYDASLFPCPPYWAAKGLIMARMRLSGAPSRSQMTLPHTLTAPTTPYLADPTRPWRRAPSGQRGLWEIPMSLVPGVRFPLIGTSLHLLGVGGLRALLPAIRRSHPEVLSLEFHGIDMLDGADAGLPGWLSARQPDLRVSAGDKRRLYAGIFELLKAHYQHRPLIESLPRP